MDDFVDLAYQYHEWMAALTDEPIIGHPDPPKLAEWGIDVLRPSTPAIPAIPAIHRGISITSPSYAPPNSPISLLRCTARSLESAPRARIQFNLFRPIPLDEGALEHQQENLVELGIIINNEGSPQVFNESDTSWDHIRVRNSEDSEIPRCLDLALEVRGATTGNPFVSACCKCSAQSPDGSSDFSLFHWARKERLIRFIRGEVRVPFRFRCSPRHHGITDTEYCLSVVVSNCGQVLGRHTFEGQNLFDHLRRKISSPTLPQSIIEAFKKSSREQTHGGHLNGLLSDRSSSGTSAGGRPSCTSVQSQSNSPASHATISQVDHSDLGCQDRCCSWPTARGACNESEMEWERGNLAPEGRISPLEELSFHMDINDKGVDREPPVLSHMNPRLGPTSGGEEIYLLVSNVPPEAVLYARFGSSIAPTAHIADGVLSCRLPAATNPGVVDITLCQAPSVHGKYYGKSLVSFEYHANTSKAVALLVKLVGETSYMEFVPRVPRSLQRTTQGSMVERVDPSSLPESAFLEILATFKDLPGFGQRLSTVNEYQQSLLHLAVHLRYRELVQTLVDWGIDLNIKDVNGFTALHAAYLCGDVTITHMLQQRGATQLSLDELGRPPVELASWLMKNPKER